MKQIHITARFLTACIALTILLNDHVAQAAGTAKHPAVEPDYTKGEDFEKESFRGKLNYQALGPTGAIGWIWAEKGRTPNTRMIKIKEVLKGTPADGILQEEDVIVGVGRSRFSSDVRKALAAAITAAEEEKNKGQLALRIWRPQEGSKGKKGPSTTLRTGKTMTVTLTLPVKRTFSKTSPWVCDKTKNIVDAACQTVLKGLWIPGKKKIKKDGKWITPAPRRNTGLTAILGVLGLLATGEEKYLPEIRKYCRDLGNPELDLDVNNPEKTSWFWSHQNLLLTEYYLATRDEYVLPAIREYATTIAEGASGVGTWGHSMAKKYTAHGVTYRYPCGYGAMNQCSITCAVSLALATKCGIKDRKVKVVLKRATDHLRWYVDKGTIPYGDHGPSAGAHDSNGKNSQAAVLFSLINDARSTDYFTRMALASYHDRENGHSGHYFGRNWGAPAAMLGGEKAARFFVEKIRWYTELERRADGSSVYQHQLSSREHRKTSGWSTTGARLLMHCLPRKQLHITGKGGSCIQPVSDEVLKSIERAANFDPEKLTTAELLAALGSWSPIVRAKAAKALGKRDEDVVEKLITMLDSKNRYERYGACEALGYAGRASQKAIDKLIGILDTSDDLTLRYYAVGAFAISREWVRTPETKGWVYPRNGLSTKDKPAKRAIPALLRQAAKYEPDRDPLRKLHQGLGGILFYSGNAGAILGYFANGEGMETVDRSLLLPAIKSLLRNPNGATRGNASSAFARLTEEDLSSLWGDIYYASTFQAPSGSMFAGGVRGNGFGVMAKHHVKEGLKPGFDWAFIQKGWGYGGRLWHSKKLAPYGPLLDELYPLVEKKIAAMPAKRKDTRVQKALDALKAAAAKVAKGPAPKLISIQKHIDAVDPKPFYRIEN